MLTDLCTGCERRDLCDQNAGCAIWKRRFIEWLDTNINRYTEPKEAKEYFCYKHPDGKEG